MVKVQEVLEGAVSRCEPETQQALRDDIKAGRMSPRMAAAFAAYLADEFAAAKSKPAADAGVAAKLDALTAAVRGVEQRLRENDAKVDAVRTPANDRSAGLLQELRNDMRSVEDKVDTLRPYQKWKIICLASVVLVAGCASGWYGRIAYRQWEYNRSVEGR